MGYIYLKHLFLVMEVLAVKSPTHYQDSEQHYDQLANADPDACYRFSKLATTFADDITVRVGKPRSMYVRQVSCCELYACVRSYTIAGRCKRYNRHQAHCKTPRPNARYFCWIFLHGLVSQSRSNTVSTVLKTLQPNLIVTSSPK